MASSNNETTVGDEADAQDQGLAVATTSATPASTPNTYEACHAVLNTAELLESVILYLPPTKIFEMQRVSSEWRDAIAASVKIQQRMFLRPVTTDERWNLLGEPYIDPDYLTQHQNVEFVTSLAVISRPITEGSMPKEPIGSVWTPAKLCPLLVRCTVYPNSAERLFENDSEDGHEMDLAPLLRRPGSWRNMYLTNPPSKDLWLDLTIELKQLPRPIISSSMHLQGEEDLTLGDVANRVFHGVHDYVYLSTRGSTSVSLPGENLQKNCTLEAFVSTRPVPQWHTDSLESFWVSIGFADVVLATDEERELGAKKAAEAVS